MADSNSTGTPQKSLPNVLDPPSGAELTARFGELLRPLLRNPAETPNVVARVVETTELFSGPIAHPRHLQAYEEIAPGGARDIINMALKEQKHRHRMQTLEMVYPYLGWFAGFVGFLACISGAVFLALQSHDGVAGGMLGVPLLGVISWFIKSRVAAPVTESRPPEAQRRRNKRKQ